MNASRKRVAARTCVICRQSFDKRQLMRFVRTPQGVRYDSTGKQTGRGAYICDNVNCRERLVTTSALSRALRVRLTDADRDHIQQAVS